MQRKSNVRIRIAVMRQGAAGKPFDGTLMLCNISTSAALPVV